MLLCSDKKNQDSIRPHSFYLSVGVWGAKGVSGDCGKLKSPCPSGHRHPETETGSLWAHWLSVVRPLGISKKSWKSRALCSTSTVGNAGPLSFHTP